MSGPKSSRYTLTPEQRRILMEQRMLERRIAAAKGKIKRNIKSINEINGLIGDQREISDIIFKANGDNTLAEIIGRLDAATDAMKAVEACTDYNDADSLEALERATFESLSAARELSKEISVVSAKIRTSLNENFESALDKGLEFSFADVKPAKSSELDGLRRKVLTRLEAMKSLEYVRMERIDQINAAISRAGEIEDVAFFKSFIALSVSPLEKAVEEELCEYLRFRDEYDGLYAEYESLCEMYYLIAQKYECTEESVIALRKEIARIKETTAEDEEQAYIAECLDEVMREMGYSVIGSREVTKKNGRRFRNELYSYGEGTAVNVTYSSDGRISMELGGMDVCDRLPSEHESAYLCGEMECFCDDFGEIERRLLLKGVVLSERISLLPPGVEYAQIINTSEYELKAEAEKLSVKKKQIKKAEPKAKKQG